MHDGDIVRLRLCCGHQTERPYCMHGCTHSTCSKPQVQYKELQPTAALLWVRLMLLLMQIETHPHTGLRTVSATPYQRVSSQAKERMASLASTTLANPNPLRPWGSAQPPAGSKARSGASGSAVSQAGVGASAAASSKAPGGAEPPAGAAAASGSGAAQQQ